MPHIRTPFGQPCPRRSPPNSSATEPFPVVDLDEFLEQLGEIAA